MLDSASSIMITDGLMGILVVVYLTCSLLSTLTTWGQHLFWFLDTLEKLEPFKLAQEALQGRFEASQRGAMRRIFYRLIVRRLEEVMNGAVIFYSGHFLVLLAVKVLGQQQAEGNPGVSGSLSELPDPVPGFHRRNRSCPVFLRP